ncbi:trypsin-like peptidase domain-containing protein [Cupriavidus necator]
MLRSLLACALPVMIAACAQGLDRQSMVSPPDLARVIGTSGSAVVSISASADGRSYLGEAPPAPVAGDIRIRWSQYAYSGAYSPSESSHKVVGGNGSGFIFSPAGLILTCAHVIESARFVRVKLPDRREFDATVVGSDLRSDIAVLRIQGDHLPVATIGDSSRVRAGNWVVAIGAPYGFQNSASFGIVSAVRRTITAGSAPIPLIQSDVAVNPGSSGGPLLNANGEVIGVSTHIFTLTGGFQGLSFAIPINPAMRIAQQLVASSHVKRGHLGVGVQDVDQDLAEAFGLPAVAGALIDLVEPDSPAAQAGVKVGDVIVQIGDARVADAMALAMAVSDLRPGSNSRLQLVRNGVLQTVAVVIGAPPSLAVPASRVQSDAVGGNGPELKVRRLAASEAYASGLNGGLLVEQARGAPRRAGILPGDVILAVNGIAVTTAAQLHSAMAATDTKAALLVLRGDVRTYIPVDTSQHSDLPQHEFHQSGFFESAI